jgi:hypothetical protein
VPPSCVARRRRTGEARIHLPAAVTRTVPCRRFPWDISTADSYMELSIAIPAARPIESRSAFECTCRSPGPRIYPIPYCASSWQSCINNWTHDDDDELNDANAIPAPGCYLLVAVPSLVRACVRARARWLISHHTIAGTWANGALCTGGPDGKRRHRIPVPGRPATVRSPVRRGTPSSACPPRDHPSVVCTVWVARRSTMPHIMHAGSIIAALQGYCIYS